MTTLYQIETKLFKPMNRNTIPLTSRQEDKPEMNQRQEWARKSSTNSRRFSESNILTSRETHASFRSNSTLSSPGYYKDEVDPSTYSFSTALRALQARYGYNCWENLSPEGFALNSKWNEAEKYISNPLSGEVPIECLSSKTLNGRSFHGLSNRITMAVPLIYSSSSQKIHSNPSFQTPIQETKMEGKTRDVGIQSTPPREFSSGSLSPFSTPTIVEKSVKRWGDSSDSNEEMESEKQVEEGKEEEKREKKRWRCMPWMRKDKTQHKPRQKNVMFPGFVPFLCLREFAALQGREVK